MRRQSEMGQAIEYARHAAAALHVIPESSFQEFETTRYIQAACRQYGIQQIELDMQTGVAALLDCGREKTVALRADIDAVPTEHGPKHLCGHDYHTASLLGAMAYLSECREYLPYNVAFFFQPGEESTQGAKIMLQNGLLKKLPQWPFRLFGIHNRPEIPCGKIAVHLGPLMAEKTNFTVRFTGRTGHGGMPHLCVDPVVAAAQFVTSLQSVVSRNVDPLEAAVCAICSIHGGTEENFAPEWVTLSGSIRSLERTVHQHMMLRLEQLAGQIARGFECTMHLHWQPQVPAVVNDEMMYRVAVRAAQKTVGAENVVDTRPCMGSEDFAVFGQWMPSFFYWVGSGATEGGSPAWHSPDFSISEAYLPVAVSLLVASATEQSE